MAKKKATTSAAKAQDDTAVKDDTAALAAVAPQFDDKAPEGVDGSTMPAFREVRRMLPAQRVKAQADLAKLATKLPDKFLAMADGEGTVSMDLRDVNGDDLDAVVDMLETVQSLVLDQAEDREAMEAWLIDQPDPLQAVMYGFTRYQEALGN